MVNGCTSTGLLLILLALLGLGITTPQHSVSAQPEITAFTCSMERCMSASSCATFAWETRGATRVSLQSGYMEDGVFIPGSWHIRDDLPPVGSDGFIMKINNALAQLCIIEPVTDEPICAVCNPWAN